MSRVIVTKLEEICCSGKGAIISGPFGSNISSKYFVEKGIPVIRGNNLSLSLDKFYDRGFVFVTEEKADELNCYAEKMDLIFTSAGTIGQVGLIPEGARYEKYVISNKQIRVRIDTSKVDILYAYYWFASPWSQKLLTSYNKGSTVPLLSLWEVKNLPITYPEDIEEQHRIAIILEKLTKKIENNKNTNSELESMAKTIYNYWFLQFEFPNEEGKPYKSSGGKMVWNEELKREIPEGWEIDTIGNHVDIIRGISYSSEELEGGGIPLINLNSFNTDSTYKSEGIKTYSGTYSKDKVIRPYDLLMCVTQQTSIDLIRNTDVIGKTFLIPDIFEGKDIVASMDVTKIEVDNVYGKYYLNRLINTNFFHRYISGFANGTKIKHLDVGGLLNYKCEIPEKTILKNFNVLMENIEEKKSKIIAENQELVSLRDFLLPLLMNGQIGFKD